MNAMSAKRARFFRHALLSGDLLEPKAPGPAGDGAIETAAPPLPAFKAVPSDAGAYRPPPGCWGGCAATPP